MVIYKYPLPILHKPSGLNKAQPTFDAQMLGSIFNSMELLICIQLQVKDRTPLESYGDT
jgi:heptaprenylglyceryl phosphate synthase